MNTSNSRYVLPTCALVASFFGVANIRYSLGLFFEALGKQTDVLPDIVRFAWMIHDYRWLMLILGTAALLISCWRAKSEAKVNLISGFYMVGWFLLCVAVQFCLVYGLNQH